MRIGVPTEIKDNEYRVGMTPSGARDLASDGHTSSSRQAPATAAASPTTSTSPAGAKILPDADAVFDAGGHDRQGQGADRGRPEAAQGRTAPLHLPPPRARARSHRGAAGEENHRHRLRDDHRRAQAARCRCSRRCPRWPDACRCTSARTTCTSRTADAACSSAACRARCRATW